ncbi:MAG: hypothetical protein K1X29_00835 [Bdellovibrionales bacterium]|nr:hypothetical protein [Bdellovibrionales bacterium]
MGKPEPKLTLIGFLIYSQEDIGFIKEILNSLSTYLKVFSISSVYRVRGEEDRNEQIHDLRAKSRFEGFTFAFSSYVEMSVKELFDRLQFLSTQNNPDPLRRSIKYKILLHGDETVLTPQLTLPHPTFHRQPAYLLPAIEIHPDLRHPILKKTLLELGQEYSGSEIKRTYFKGEFVCQGKSLLEYNSSDRRITFEPT